MKICHKCHKEIDDGPFGDSIYGPDGEWYHGDCYFKTHNKTHYPCAYGAAKEINKLDVKDTKGKPKLGLLYKAALDAMARVRERGTAKYGSDPESWRNYNEDDYYHAILRHATKLCDAHFNPHSIFTIEDEEMKENHAACIMVNCMFLLELEAERTRKNGDSGGK